MHTPTERRVLKAAAELLNAELSPASTRDCGDTFPHDDVSFIEEDGERLVLIGDDVSFEDAIRLIVNEYTAASDGPTFLTKLERRPV